ncbi:hypothetical protein JL722_6328 [Aureococcus anophagefferens]|nr:hypothetical protein JL722_6328 [Aureococcus anophagefferens]
MTSLYEQEVEELGGGFQVYPRTSTPHLDCISSKPLDGAAALAAACEVCGAEGENWICLATHKCLCSRYVAGHAKEHAEASGAKIAVSLADLSFWDFGQGFGEAPTLPSRDRPREPCGVTLTLELGPAAESKEPR